MTLRILLFLAVLGCLVKGKAETATTYYELKPYVCDDITACTINDSEDASNSLTESRVGATFTLYDWSANGNLTSVHNYFCPELSTWTEIPTSPYSAHPVVIYGACQGTNKTGSFKLTFTVTGYLPSEKAKWQVTGGIVSITE